ncbi:MAG: rhodanese-like domain-containing protein [Bellilinea sp.]
MTRKVSRSTGKIGNSWVWIAGFAILALIVVGAISAMTPPDATASLAREISVSEAATLRDQGAFMLDVREPDEWNAGHIPEATLIPLGELESRLDELPRDQQIVVVCRSGNRSATGRDILLDAGFKEVTSMGGGMNSWVSQGLPTVTGP